MDEISRALKRVRRRMVAQIFLENFTRWGLLAAGFLLVSACWSYVFRGNPWDATLAWMIVAGALLAVCIASLLQRPSLEETAMRMDRLADTRDRFLTAFAFAKTAPRLPLQDLALEECKRFVGGFGYRPFVRLKVPRRMAFILVPVVAILLLVWHARLTSRLQSPLAKQELSEKSRELEILSQQLGEAARQLESEELKKIADEMKKSAARLKSEQSDDAAKAGLRELSSLESMINAIKNNAAPGELAALAAALQQDALTNAAAKDIQAGDLQNAADKLEQLAGKDEETLGKIAQAMEDALKKRDQNPQTQVAQRMADLARASRANEAKDGAREQALKNLAAALRRMGGTRQAQRGGKGEATSQAMQNLLGRLQELKYSAQQGAAKSGSRQNPSDSRLLVPSPGGSTPKDQLVIGPPSGQPGSERDIGTTETPFGPREEKPADPSEATQLSGMLGEGESLQDFMLTTGDDSKSARRYRDIYNAMAPAAEDALTQENIPLGSRFFVKRYFQNIRPKE